jgi:hypothetical protein
MTATYVADITTASGGTGRDEADAQRSDARVADLDGGVVTIGDPTPSSPSALATKSPPIR